MAKIWPSLATESTDTFGIDWTKLLPSGKTVTSVAYESFPSGLTFSDAQISGNISTVDITANEQQGDYFIKATPTLSSGSISARSLMLPVVQHKNP